MTTTNPKSNDGKCFQYAIIAALNYKQIKSHPERTSKIKPFIEQYNSKEIDFSSHQTGKRLKKNKSIAHNIIYVPHNTEEIRYVHKSKYDKKRGNKVIFLIQVSTENDKLLFAKN